MKMRESSANNEDDRMMIERAGKCIAKLTIQYCEYL